jgi:HK97 family phage prohead protease
LNKYVTQSDFHDLASRGDASGAAVEVPAHVLRTSEGSRRVTFVLSDDSVDRVGDTLAVDGWDIASFRKNPVVLWAHDSSSPPIGKMWNIRANGGRLLGDVEFAPPETYEFADQIFRLVRDGFIRAGSVGFIALDYSFSNDDDRPFGIDYKRQELLEFSIVPIPANAHALVQLQAKGLLNYCAAEQTEPVPSVMQFGGTARDRRWALAHHLRQAIRKG